MTSATLANGKRVTMTMEEKSYLLRVVAYEPGTLAVISNSDSRVAYAIGYNNRFEVTSCACTGCKQHGRTQCAYRIAGTRKLAEMKRNYFCDVFGIYA